MALCPTLLVLRLLISLNHYDSETQSLGYLKLNEWMALTVGHRKMNPLSLPVLQQKCFHAASHKNNFEASQIPATDSNSQCVGKYNRCALQGRYSSARLRKLALVA